MAILEWQYNKFFFTAFSFSSASSVPLRFKGVQVLMKKLKVGVLFGGRSGEHEISLLSAASVLKAIDPQEI